MKHRKISIIGAASGWGSPIRSTEQGPDYLNNFGFTEKLSKAHLDVGWLKTIYPRHKASESSRENPPPALAEIVPYTEAIFQTVIKEVRAQHFPVILGGDQTSAIGTWSGLTYALDAVQNFGLIWIDAYMDAHTLKTSSSRAYHEMPVACLLGHGVPELVNLGGLGAKLRPEHMVQIGTRSFEEGEDALLKYLGVRIFSMDEIQVRGFEEVWNDAIAIVAKGTKGFGVSIDLNVFEPTEAPGVGAPKPGGLHQKDVLKAFAKIALNPRFKAFEICEYTPEQDIGGMTAQLSLDLAKALLH